MKKPISWEVPWETVELKTFYGWRRSATGSYLWVDWKYITYFQDIRNGQMYCDDISVITSLSDTKIAPTGDGWEPVYYIQNPKHPDYDPEKVPTPAAGF